MCRFNCPKCLREFNRKYNLNTHLNKKFDCILTKDNINQINNDFDANFKEIQNNPKQIQNIPFTEKITEKNSIINLNELKNSNFYCGFCSKIYSSKSNLNKHTKNCKIKKESDNNKEKIFQLLLEKDKENKDKISKLEKQNIILMNKIDKLLTISNNSKPSKLVNNNNQVITNNTQNNNIVIVNFGKEDLSVIDENIFIDRIIKKPLLSGVKIPDEVLRIIHFNHLYPQLSNIYISDINRDKCMVYEDGEWKLSNIDNIPFIMDKICLFSADQINNLRNKYPNNKQLNDRLNLIEKYNNMIDSDYLEDLKDDEQHNKPSIKRCEDFQKLTYNTIKKTLYNEGKKIKKNIN
jgi:hypothetical protein